MFVTSGTARVVATVTAGFAVWFETAARGLALIARSVAARLDGTRGVHRARLGGAVCGLAGCGGVPAGLAAATTAVVVVATRPTTFEGNAAGTLNPYVVTDRKSVV